MVSGFFGENPVVSSIVCKFAPSKSGKAPSRSGSKYGNVSNYMSLAYFVWAYLVCLAKCIHTPEETEWVASGIQRTDA